VTSAISFSEFCSNLQGMLKIVKIEFHFFIFFLKRQIKKFFFPANIDRLGTVNICRRPICAGLGMVNMCRELIIFIFTL
jgi:hypothetical protein